MADGRALRLFLETPPQFEAFWIAFGNEVASKAFIHEPPVGSDADETIEEEAAQAA